METNLLENVTVEMIHNDFKRAENFIENNYLIDYNLRKIQNSQKIQKFGFINKENQLSKSAELEKLSKKLIDILPNYKSIFESVKRKYPFFKAITGEQVEYLCKKYNLFYSDTKNYIGNIPDKNIVEMERFEDYFFNQDSLQEEFTEMYRVKYNDEDFEKWFQYQMLINVISFEITTLEKWGGYQSEKISTVSMDSGMMYFFSITYYRTLNERGFKNNENYQILVNLQKIFKEHCSKNYCIPNKYVKSMNYKIIAPLSDFSFNEDEYKINTKNNKIEQFNNDKNKEEEIVVKIQTIKESAPDPIVLMPLNLENFTLKENIGDKKLYLIVTAWGEEANDELVVNEKLN